MTTTTGSASTIYVGQLDLDMYSRTGKDLVWRATASKALEDHRKPTHPMTFGETNTFVKRLIATRPNLLIGPEYSKDTARICPRCVSTPRFPLADPNVVLSLLGYC